MISPPIPDNEEERLRHLNELNILDTLEEECYDDLTSLAAQICHAPISLISLIDHDRQWFKSRLGLSETETSRELAFCAHAILQDDLFIVENARTDPRFKDHPLVTGPPNLAFYAGAPLIISPGIRLGTLCVIGDQPSKLDCGMQKALVALARQVVSQFKLRLHVKQLLSLESAKDEFISMVSHEMRTPLTSINGSLSLLQNGVTGPLESEPRHMVDIAQRNATRLLDIVNDILDLAKIKAGKLVLDIRKYNIADLIDQAVILNQQFAADHDCTLVIDNPQSSDPVMVNCDQFRIIQVLTNFISNAVKYTRNQDTIKVSLRAEKHWVTVEVEDHGPGIPSDKQDLLFERFSQINEHHNYKQPGTGLGLNISQHLVELQHGSVGFSSIPNKNTIFHFRLPRVPA